MLCSTTRRSALAWSMPAGKWHGGQAEAATHGCYQVQTSLGRCLCSVGPVQHPPSADGVYTEGPAGQMATHNKQSRDTYSPSAF
jgi:hypothetical protein